MRDISSPPGPLLDDRFRGLSIWSVDVERARALREADHAVAGDAAVAWSGGSEPGDQVNPAPIAAMKERGIDISREYPKPWTDEIVRVADVVITMGCGDALSRPAAAQHPGSGTR